MNNNLEGSANSPTYNYFFALPEEKYGPLWTQIKILRSSYDPVLKTTFKKDI